MCVFNRIKFGYFVSIFTLGTYAINGPIYAYYATASIQHIMPYKFSIVRLLTIGY